MKRFAALLLPFALSAACGTYETARKGAAPSELSVEADRKIYSPVMSSAPGIGLTPTYAGGKHPPFIRFHWAANYGYFVEWGPPDYEPKTLGPSTTRPEGKVYWTYDPLAMDDEKPPVMIQVTAQDIRTEKSLASARIELAWENVDTAAIAR